METLTLLYRRPYRRLLDSPAHPAYAVRKAGEAGMEAEGMAGENWDKDADGNITIKPYCGCSTATLPEGKCMLRLEFLSSPDQSIEAASAVQLVLTRGLAFELAEAIRQMASTPHMDAPPTESKH